MKTPVTFILKVKLQWSFYRVIYLNRLLTVYKSFTLKSVVAQSQYFWLSNNLLCFCLCLVSTACISGAR